MIRVDQYGRGYTQIAHVADQFKVQDTRDIYVMKIPEHYKQKLLAEGMWVKFYTYDKVTNTYYLPPSAGKKTEPKSKIEFKLKSSELYPEQVKVLSDIRKAGDRAAFIESDTGTGKSFILSGLIALHKCKTIIVVPNISIARGLLEKISKRSDKVYLAQGSKIKGAEETNDIVICHHSTFNTHYDYINGKYPALIIDECFVAGTKVDGKNIEDIKVGDYVKSYNHNTNQIEYKKVIRLFRNPPKQLIKIGNLICTPDHPIWDGNKYSLAKDFKINSNMMLYIIQQTYGLQKNLQMHMVLKKIRKRFKTKMVGLSQMTLKNILFKTMLKIIFLINIKGYFSKYKSQICVRQDEKKQSNVDALNQRKNENNIKSNKTYAKNTRWQWKALTDTTTNVNDSIMMASRGCSKHMIEDTRLISSSLQNRHRKRNIKNLNRGGLIKSFFSFKTKTRQKENGITGIKMMENPKVLEQTSDRTFGGMCKDGYVYNIEVEDNNNYFANGILVHNCHHLPPKRIKQLSHWKGSCTYGLSATPIRKEFGRDGIEKIFGKIYATGLSALPVKVLIHKFRYDYSADELEGANEGLAPDSNEIFRRLVVNNEKRYTELQTIIKKLDLLGYTKIIIFSDRVEHIEKTMNSLRPLGFDIVGYYGASNKDESEKLIKSSNKYIIVGHPTSCGEGFDVPELEATILFTSTGWEGIVRQMAGRARRVEGNKKEGILVDFVDQLSIMGGKTKSLSFSKRMKIYKQLDWETTAL